MMNMRIQIQLITRASAVVLLAVVGGPVGCGVGTAYTDRRDGGGIDGTVVLPDGAVADGSGPLPDGSGPLPDGAPPTPDASVQPDAAPTGCGALGCQANAWCDTSTDLCHCLTGFVDDGGGGCVAVNPGDPAARSQTDMCQRWSDDHQITTSPAWTAGPTTCDPGTLAPGAIADTVAYINLYRYLCGLSPLADDPTLNESAQYCAIIQDQQGFLDHTPDTSAPCYTTEGGNAAGSSNLALGPSHPAPTIDLYIDDSGVSSLGHRRWILNPSYGPAGIGHAGNAGCLYVFSWSNSGSPDFVAWPNQGYTPLSVIPTVWSFSSGNYSLNAGTGVEVVRLSDMTSLSVSIYLPPPGYGQPAIAFSATGWSAQAGETYEVTLSDSTGPMVVYQVKPVSCP
jgi:uncharacterized protein YkwD